MYKSLPVILTIRTKMDDLTKIQKQIAEYVLRNPSNAVKMSISELAAVSGAKSESSVVRFYRTLGFSGYHDFKVSLATEIAGKSFYHVYSEITGEDDLVQIKEKIFQGTIKSLYENLTAINNELLIQAVELLFNAKRIILLGYGQSIPLCQNAFFKFTRIGYNCINTQDSHLNAIVLSEPQEGDVVVGISSSGLTKDVVIPVEDAKPIVKIIALTGSEKSPLGKIADVCIATHTEELNYRTDVLIERHIQAVIIDILYLSVVMKKGDIIFNKLDRSRQSLSYLKF